MTQDLEKRIHTGTGKPVYLASGKLNWEEDLLDKRTKRWMSLGSLSGVPKFETSVIRKRALNLVTQNIDHLPEDRARATYEHYREELNKTWEKDLTAYENQVIHQFGKIQGLRVDDPDPDERRIALKKARDMAEDATRILEAGGTEKDLSEAGYKIIEDAVIDSMKKF
tara:strand:+ start:64 stop:567 length:504 start_codon:yes stop_codon:yes gene_type:complete